MKRSTRPVLNREHLRERLDTLVATFDLSTVTPDPLELVMRYDRAEDQEVAGLVAAAFAYGRAEIVVRNVGNVLERMGRSPYAYVQRFDIGSGRRRFADFRHRFHATEDLVVLLAAISGAVREHGTLGELFRSCDQEPEADIRGALTRFAQALIGFAPRRSRTAALRYLITSPADGSACKRMNLFLRWMVRRESPDLGLWTFVDPSRLVIPLDTHVHRISTFLGLNRRRSADWKAARLLTDELALLSPHDPVRYDFAICRLGVLDLCSRKRSAENCSKCLLLDVCRFPVHTPDVVRTPI